MGISYELNDVFFSMNGVPFKLIEIAITTKKELFFYCQELKVKFVNNLKSYEIEKCLDICKMLTTEDMKTSPVNYHEFNNKQYFRVQNFC